MVIPEACLPLIPHLDVLNIAALHHILGIWEGLRDKDVVAMDSETLLLPLISIWWIS